MMRIRFPLTLIAAVFCSLCLTQPLFGQDAPASPVTVEVIRSAKLPHTIRLPGTVTARRSSRLSAEVDGLVADVLVDEGDQVTAGQVLIRLRTTPTQLALEAALAEHARAKAGAQLAALREQRNAELLVSQMVPEETYDIAAAELSANQAQVASAAARVAMVRDELKRHEIRAPFDAVIGSKLTEAGAWVRAGDVVLTLEELAVVRIRFALPQIHYQQVTAGTPVEFQADALPGERFTAPVSTKVRVGNIAARTFPILVDIDNPEGRMAPGMSVDVAINVAGEQSAAAGRAVSADAVVMRPDGTELLWLVVEDGPLLTVQPVPVVTGRRFEEQVEIARVLRGELPDGSKIVVQGNENLRPGQPIRLIE